MRLKVIGSGKDRVWLQRRARSAGVMDLVEWVSSTPHGEMAQEYQRSVALVFPSLHDSGGMVVLEALASGLPVICLDLGGPGAIVTPSCAVAVRAQGEEESAVIHELAESMVELAKDHRLRAELSARGPERARELTWDRAAEAVYSAVDRREEAN
jgi:glycosyltransferase involved in cell wall biosynthesis